MSEFSPKFPAFWSRWFSAPQRLPFLADESSWGSNPRRFERADCVIGLSSIALSEFISGATSDCKVKVIKNVLNTSTQGTRVAISLNQANWINRHSEPAWDLIKKEHDIDYLVYLSRSE